MRWLFLLLIIVNVSYFNFEVGHAQKAVPKPEMVIQSGPEIASIILLTEYENVSSLLKSNTHASDDAKHEIVVSSVDNCYLCDSGDWLQSTFNSRWSDQILTSKDFKSIN